jgi:type IV secretory pathway VirD2 relaxase
LGINGFVLQKDESVNSHITKDKILSKNVLSVTLKITKNPSYPKEDNTIQKHLFGEEDIKFYFI